MYSISIQDVPGTFSALFGWEILQAKNLIKQRSYRTQNFPAAKDSIYLRNKPRLNKADPETCKVQNVTCSTDEL